MEKHCCETQVLEFKGELIWKIRGFMAEGFYRTCQSLISQRFRANGHDANWYVKLCATPITASDPIGQITACLYADEIQKKVLITCELSLLSKDLLKMYAVTETLWFQQNGTIKYLVPPNKVISDQDKQLLLPNDVLTLSCVLIIKKELVYPRQSSVDLGMGNSLTDDFTRLFLEEKKNADVLLKAGTAQIEAHQTVLACRSSVFASMFQHDMKEKKTSEVLITDIESDVLRDLIRFMYTDKVEYRDVHFALKLMLAANKYNVGLLQTLIASYLSSQISIDHVFEILVVANVCLNEKLKESCMAFMKGNMTAVACISQLKNFPEALQFINANFE